MKALLTGHKGFIGNNLLNQLGALKIEVMTIEREFFENTFWPVMLEEYLKRCDLVFHVGAISDTSLQDSTEMLKYNYAFSKELFDSAQKHRKKVVYSSSAACLGNDTSGLPSNIYGWSKLLAESYGVAKCDGFVSLRYFNVYGPGEEHKNKMASVAYQAWHRGFFRLFPSRPQRDFVYIDDVVDANICAMDSPGGIYEVGFGKARTIESLLDGMGIEYGHHDPIEVPSWYQHYTCADSNKRPLGWEPKFNLEQGTKKYKEHLNEVFSNRR